MSAPAAASGDRLGDLLIKEGLITKDQLDKALAEQRSSGSRLGYALVKLGFVQETEITKMLARQYRMPAVDLSRFEVDPKIVKLIPGDVALKHMVLPLKREGRTLTVAMADPTNLSVIDDLKFITRYEIFPVIAGEYTLRTQLEKHYEQVDQQLDKLIVNSRRQLSDETFLSRAPEKVVLGIREKLAEYEAQIAKSRSSLNGPA